MPVIPVVARPGRTPAESNADLGQSDRAQEKSRTGSGTSGRNESIPLTLSHCPSKSARLVLGLTGTCELPVIEVDHLRLGLGSRRARPWLSGRPLGKAVLSEGVVLDICRLQCTRVLG